jgi:glycosyltransferase involved in cell wall biosynthesis
VAKTILLEHEAKHGTRFSILHFDWINDFAAARNHGLSSVKEDYWMWMDLDDTLKNKEAFIKWRNNAMEFADYWLATYNYALDKNRNSVCSFVRERVIRTNKEFKWHYFVHEGIIPDKPVKAQQVTTWAIDHERTQEDVTKDKGRNLKLFEGKTGLGPRMTFYLGKEQFENGLMPEAFTNLLSAAADSGTEMHDRLLSFQYACYAAMNLNQPDRAIQLAHQGLQLVPKRAEFHCIIGECYVKRNQFTEAIPYFAAAKTCIDGMVSSSVYAAPIFSSKDAYGLFPRNMLVRCYASVGMFDLAEVEAKECLALFNNVDTKLLLDEIEKTKKLLKVPEKGEAQQTGDIVFTGAPNPGPYEWDEEKAKTQGMGGSETACIQMASHLHDLTGRRVIVFNHRDKNLTASSGVEYKKMSELNEYFSKNIPKAHIAWRHNIRLTSAPSYAWVHDLMLPGGEFGLQQDKALCLTPFHADYVESIQGIPAEKIIVTRNGIEASRFKHNKVKKDPLKMCFVSSPDRGLDRAMNVLDIVRSRGYDVKLHVYYGIEHLHQYGLQDLQTKLRTMMDSRPWVIYHGKTQQDVMVEQLRDASVWTHFCDFIETSCISAMEMVLNGIYPVTRRLGGLKDTLKVPEELGMATLLDHDCVTEAEHIAYADATIDAIEHKRWEKINLDPDYYDWKVVAAEWQKFMQL